MSAILRGDPALISSTSLIPKSSHAALTRSRKGYLRPEEMTEAVGTGPVWP
jgi:hypothetical protein